MHDKRIDAGLTLNEAIFKAWNLLPEPNRKAPKMLERYETNWQEDKADAIFVAALAAVYGCAVADLSEVAAERLKLVASLARPVRTRSRCSDVLADDIASVLVAA